VSHVLCLPFQTPKFDRTLEPRLNFETLGLIQPVLDFGPDTPAFHGGDSGPAMPSRLTVDALGFQSAMVYALRVPSLGESLVL